MLQNISLAQNKNASHMDLLLPFYCPRWACEQSARSKPDHEERPAPQLKNEMFSSVMDLENVGDGGGIGNGGSASEWDMVSMGV